MALSKNEKIKHMINEYGRAQHPEFKCGNCCNCQKHPKNSSERFCLAFGLVDDIDCTWDIKQWGCGLYNRPFLGLVPKHKQMIDMITAIQPKLEESEGQVSLFK